jgi:hypothetical protein
MVGRLTSSIRWAGIASADGSGRCPRSCPIWRLGDPFLGLSYAAAGFIADLGLGGSAAASPPSGWWRSLADWRTAPKPLTRSIVRLGGWQYELAAGGSAVPAGVALPVRVAGAIIGVGFLYVTGQRAGRIAD